MTIEELRKSSRLTITQIAYLLGVSVTTVSNWMTGKTNYNEHIINLLWYTLKKEGLVNGETLTSPKERD